jgi:hypothetical protein
MVDVDDGIAARTLGRARSGVYSSARLGAFTRFVAFSTADRPYPSALRCVRCVRAMSDGASLTSAWVLPCVLVRSSKWRTAPARPRRARERDRPGRRDASQKSTLWSDSSSGSTFSFNNAKRAFALQSQPSLGSPAVSGNNVRDDE